MRRTTICRSKASVTFVLLPLALAAAAAPAQNPPPSQPPAQQPSAPTGPLPAVHVVQAGETLWSLAQQYFGDPLLWPEIYRLNTDVVEDPHWIFPGEELRLQSTAVAEQPVPGGQPTVVTVTPSTDSAAAPAPVETPARSLGPTIFSPAPRTVGTSENIEIEAARGYRAVREGEYYSAAFLTEGVALVTGRLLGNVQSSAIRRLSTATSALLFTDVAVEVPAGETFAVGDLALSLRRTGDIRGFGDVVVPTGLLRITAVGDGRAVARVISLYGAVTDGQEVMKIAPYRAPAGGRPVDVENGIAGEVIGLVNPGDVVNLQDGLFINRGVQEGVRLGDVFQISGSDRSRNDFNTVVLPQAQALVVNVRPHTATAIIVQLSRPDVRTGSVVRQIKRMPS